MQLEEILEDKLNSMRVPSTLLLSMENSDYNSHLVAVMKTFLHRRKGDAVYVTFSKPAQSLADLFEPLDCRNRLLFLDVVSTHMGEKAELENAFFVSFPGDLTGLMVVLSRMLKMHNFRFLFLDSLSSLLLYNDERTSTRFLHALSAMCKKSSLHLVLLSSEDVPGTFQNSISAMAVAHLKRGA